MIKLQSAVPSSSNESDCRDQKQEDSDKNGEQKTSEQNTDDQEEADNLENGEAYEDTDSNNNEATDKN